MDKIASPDVRFGISLTQRESEVCERICDGKLDKEIASELGITVNTLRGYLRILFLKLGVISGTRTGLASKYREHMANRN